MNIFKTFYIVLFSCMIGAFASSCKKDIAAILGAKIQPEDENINGYRISSDSLECLQIAAYTVIDDTVVTSGKSNYALGSYYHPKFGTMTANIITQLFEYNTSDTVRYNQAGWKIDSVVLYLSHLNAYPFREGTPMEKMTVSIKELVDYDTVSSASLTRVYYNNQDRARAGLVLGDQAGNPIEWKTIEPNLRDSMPDPDDSTQKIANTAIPIHLNHYYGEKLLLACLTRAAEDGNENVFMRAGVPGLYIEAKKLSAGEKGNIINFDFYTNKPLITVYYSKPEDTVSTEKIFSLNFSGSMTYNYIQADHTTAENYSTAWQTIGKDAEYGEEDKTLGDEQVFVQSFFGSFFRIELSDSIRKFRQLMKDKHQGKEIIINQACVIMKVISDENTLFSPPSGLDMRNYVRSDSVETMRDHSFFTGGSYNENRSEYRLYLTRHIQKLLLDETAENHPITVFSTDRTSLPTLVGIHGPKAADPNKRMRLEIVYSVLP